MTRPVELTLHHHNNEIGHKETFMSFCIEKVQKQANTESKIFMLMLETENK